MSKVIASRRPRAYARRQPMDEFKKDSALPEREDLAKRSPRRYRSILKKSFWFICAALFAIIGYLGILLQGPETENPGRVVLQDGMEEIAFWLMIVVVFAAVVKVLYEILFHVLYTYSIELEHLVISKGVFFRSRSTFPIARINDVSIQRGPTDMIFGLYAISVLTASPVAIFGTVDGLDRRGAVGLQSYLLALVESTLPNVLEENARNIANNKLTESEAEEALHPGGGESTSSPAISRI